MTRYAVLALLSLTACPPPVPPGPVPPDASDAAPTPALDASAAPDAPPVPLTPCVAACLKMAAVCGPQATDCVTVMAKVDGARLIREPNGKPLTCADLASATSKPAMAALGVHCP